MNTTLKLCTTLLLSCALMTNCNNSGKPLAEEEKEAVEQPDTPDKYTVIFDTDANNELDDQHAQIYLLFNGNDFVVKGITVNATHSGGEIANHYQEAERILKLSQLDGKVPLYSGANGDFEEIRNRIYDDDFDGKAAVDFIIEEALNIKDQKLVLIPVGKLTNIALALLKQPSIAEKIRIVWLGSNYPKPGEYNQDNDIPSMNYVLSTKAPFEMVTVRYEEPSGTAAITVTQAQINESMPGRGPRIEDPITGRHGGTYHTFGDYSVSLFEHIDYHSEARERALFDVAAVAVIKNPAWGKVREHPAPIYEDSVWVEQPENERKIMIWENFDKESIVQDLFHALDNPVLVTTK